MTTTKKRRVGTPTRPKLPRLAPMTAPRALRLAIRLLRLKARTHAFDANLFRQYGIANYEPDYREHANLHAAADVLASKLKAITAKEE